MLRVRSGIAAAFVVLLACASTASAAVLDDPTWGYDVFRPYALNPAPCQTACSGAVDGAGGPVSLRSYYETLAAANSTLVERVPYGTSVQGTELVAYRVTAGAGSSAHGAKPGVVYAGAQHGSEWISAEVVRRGFEYVLAHKTDVASGIPAVLASTELWFVPVMNPDGYDYTFQTRETRLWRKNLRDRDHDGVIEPGDGVDTNRNFSDHWGYDDEGSSGTRSSDAYRGSLAESEPEVAGFDTLMSRIDPEFLVDYRAFGERVLYPLNWQAQTDGGDQPLMETLAGTEDDPAVAGYEPGVAGEFATANGEVTDTMYLQRRVLSFAVELDGGSGGPVGGTTTAGNAVGSDPGGYVFQDREADVEAVFAKNLPFMLDLARSAPAPDEAVSHLGAQAPDFVPTAFGLSYDAPQIVEVNVRRVLGPTVAKWTIGGSPVVHEDSTIEFKGGFPYGSSGVRYGQPGIHYRRMRGYVSGFRPGDEVTVWFEADGERSDPFTFTASPLPHEAEVLVLAAEDHGGAGPAYLGTYLEALTDAGITADAFDLDAGGEHADLLGVLKRYRAVVWYTGRSAGGSQRSSDQMLAIRDYLNEGGKVVIAGQRALDWAWQDPLADDFLRSWMGAFQRTDAATTEAGVGALTIFGLAPSFTASFGLRDQAYLARFTPTTPRYDFDVRATHFASSGGAVGVSAPGAVLWGFGLENIADRATRSELIRQGLERAGWYRFQYACSCVPVQQILSLSVGSPTAFGTFVPGNARSYLATASAAILSTAGDALLSVADTSATAPGHLVNGAFSLPQPIEARANGGAFGSISRTPVTLLTHDGPVQNLPVAIEFRQTIGATDVLRTGVYSKTLTFSLSMTAP